ncbi:MAG: glycosyltransferase family 1 protein [Glaciihabitans sp.]|nr:glycosyltransferase family 1 protein [Glaciihabitans sp.]
MNSLPIVLLDATAIPAEVGGVGRYVEELLARYDSDGRIVVVAQAASVERLKSIAPGVTVVAAPARISSRPLRMLWEQFALPRLAKRLGATLIHSPHYTMPVFAGLPVVVTLHDATFFSDPEVHSRGKRVFFRAWTRYSLKHAAAIIVPSAATRDELARYLPGSTARVVVIHHGVDLDQFHVPTPAERGAAAELVGAAHWIAFLGTLEPRKNVGSLVRAFGDLGDEVFERFPDLRLVLAGAKGWDTSLASAIADSPRADRIVQAGYVPREALTGILGGSVLVCYPSLGEGFGLPVLEAMACGASVLTTRRLALPEVGGDAARYSEPDEKSLAAAITALALDENERRTLPVLARERAETFSWNATADAHAEVFASVAMRDTKR